MRVLVATLSPEGRITLPDDVQEALGVKPLDSVAFGIEDGQVRLVRAELTVETSFGSVEPRNRPEDFKEISPIAREEHARRVVEKMRES